MSSTEVSRRRFLSRTGTVAVGALTVSGVESGLAAGSAVDWAVGCFNRPWGNFSFDDALDGLQAGGFKTTGLVGQHKQKTEALLRPDSQADYLARLRERIEAHGLKPVVAWISGITARDREGKVAELKAFADNAAKLGVGTLLSGGPRRNEGVRLYSGMISELAAHAADKGVKVAMKPHGGDGAEIQQCLELANHPNFSLWYDAGNIIYYTGGDPVKELKGLAPHVTGFCAKDCGGQKSPVMIQFGEGKVDFKGVFQALKDAGFNGPVMIECTGDPKSPEHVTRQAVANREFLKRVFETLK
jgi:sugar phosphate isomerase/epimerase